MAGETMIGTCAQCGKTTTGAAPIVRAGSPPAAFVCLECAPDVFVPYVGGPLEGGYTPFPRTCLLLDAYEERSTLTGMDQAKRYVLRCDDAGWAFMYAGPVD